MEKEENKGPAGAINQINADRVWAGADGTRVKGQRQKKKWICPPYLGSANRGRVGVGVGVVPGRSRRRRVRNSTFLCCISCRVVETSRCRFGITRVINVAI